MSGGFLNWTDMDRAVGRNVTKFNVVCILNDFFPDVFPHFRKI